MVLSALIEHVVGQPPSHARKHHYKFGKTLGAGAFGVVRQATCRDTNEQFAIKVILKSKLRTTEQAQAVMDEFKILSKMDHKHIVKMREWFESKDKLYMVAQLCTGGELFDRIIDYGSFTEKDAARVISEVSGAVHYMHERNIVHRDIKPENLLYEHASKDGSASLVLCDFGVAKSLLSGEDVISSAAGSLGYAAPEVFDSKGYSKPVDVWSLGVVLYTILSGVSPFQAETADAFVSEVRPGFKPYFYPKYWSQVSDQAKTLVTGMLEYDPKKRLTIEQVCTHPWVSQGESNAEVDLLPTVKPELEARRRWRSAFEKIRLVKRLRHLHISEGSDDEDEDDSGSRFLQVVAAATAQATADNSRLDDIAKKGTKHEED